MVPSREGPDVIEDVLAAGGLRTDAERAAFDVGTRYAETRALACPPETAYLEVLPAARRDILGRFARGVLRGRPAGLPDPVVGTPEAATLSVPDDPHPLDRVDGGKLLAAAPIPPGSERVALLPLPAVGSVLVVPLDAVYGFDRFQPAGPVTACSPGRPRSEAQPVTHAVEHPVDLAWVLALEGAFVDADQAERIRAELAESVANLALARLAATVHERDSAEEAGRGPPPDPATALERGVIGGHPFHPCAKIRRGMSPSAAVAYGPEFARSIDLRFVAVRTDHALRCQSSSTGPSLGRRLYGSFDGLADAVAGAVPGGTQPEAYTVLPVHPWQYHHVLPTRYAAQLDDARVVPVPYTHSATPLLNVRTVVPHPTRGTTRTAGSSQTDAATRPVGGEGQAGGHLPHCKLAIGVQLTNVERTLSPQAVHNGPRATALLRKIADRESLEHLGLLAEPAAACYHPPGGPHPDGQAYDDARHLSALVRQNPYDHPFATGDARLVPAARLAARPNRASGPPLIRELVERYAAATKAADGRATEAALGFLTEYADVLVPEHLRLQCKYGVALESHLQNAIAVLEEGRPTATLVRDFGGIRVHSGRLADHGLTLDPYPDSDLAADGVQDLYRKLYYALFQNHLAELIVALVRSTPVSESDCWSRVADRCHEAFATLRADSAVPDDRVARDEAALFRDPAVHKALTAMRLRGKRHEYVTSRVSNPLAPFAR